MSESDEKETLYAGKGDWVRIHSVLLKPEDRSVGIPDDTARVPVEKWEKGFLQNDNAEVGSIAEIETLNKRKVSGTLVEVFPVYRHSFGSFVPEILEIDCQLTSIMKEIRCEQ